MIQSTKRTFPTKGLVSVVSPAKAGTSMFAQQLAVSVASGLSESGNGFLGIEAKRGKVLLVDCQHHPETLYDRLGAISQALGVSLQDFGSSGLEFVAMRTMKDRDNLSLDSLANYVAKGSYDLVILDAVDMMWNLPEDVARTPAEWLRKLDHIAGDSPQTLVVVTMTDYWQPAKAIETGSDLSIRLMAERSLRFRYPLWKGELS